MLAMTLLATLAALPADSAAACKNTEAALASKQFDGLRDKKAILTIEFKSAEGRDVLNAIANLARVTFTVGNNFLAGKHDITRQKMTPYAFLHMGICTFERAGATITLQGDNIRIANKKSKSMVCIGPACEKG